MITPPDDESVRPSAPASAWARLGGIAVSAACLVAVIVWAARQDAPNLPSDRSALSQLALAIGMYAVAMTLRGERWLQLLRRDGGRAGRGDAYALEVVGYMGNNVLPARGGDAIRVYLMKPRSNGTYRDIVGTLLAERVLDAGFLLGLFILLGYFILDGIDVPDSTPLLVLAAVVLLVFATVLVAARLGRDKEIIQRVVGFVAPMLAATRDLHGGFGIQMVTITTVIWLFEAATYWAAGAAAGLEMTVLEALYIVALASVFVLIPSGPGYVGTLDAALIFGARAVGATGAVAVSFLLLVRFVLLVPVTVLGLVLLFVRYGGWNSLRGARGAEAA